MDERTGFKTPQQPVIYKVLIPAKQSALNDDLDKIEIKTLQKMQSFFSMKDTLSKWGKKGTGTFFPETKILKQKRG